VRLFMAGLPVAVWLGSRNATQGGRGNEEFPTKKKRRGPVS
jgi:hypothetical protein